VQTEEEYPESYLRLVEQMEQLFSENISIKRAKSGGGKIVIDFANDEEIASFIERLQNR
jgi:ParB family chromosome partitioning protein